MSTVDTEAAPAPAESPGPVDVALRPPDRVDRWLESRRGIAWALTTVLLGLVAIIVVVPAATSVDALSPVDEYVYTDALDKADRGELSNMGDKVDEYARQVVTCRGVMGVSDPTSTCGMPQPDASVPLNGFTSADIHPPTYFFLTAAVSKAIKAVGLTHDVLIAGRLAGALWLTLGLLAMVALGRVWGAGWVMPVLTATAVGTSPLLVSVSGYVSPDAMGLLVGAGVLLAVTHWQRGTLPSVVLLLAALTPAFVKVPFVLAPLFGALLLVIAALAKHTSWRRALIGSTILVGGAGAGAIAWQQIRAHLAVGVPTMHPEAAEPVAFSSFARYLGYYLETIPVNSGAPIPVTPLLVAAVQPLAWLLLAAALGGLLLRRRDDPLLPLSWAGMAGMVLGSIVLSLVVLVATGGFLVGTPRYGLALLPLFAVSLMCTRHPLVVLGLVASAGASVWAHLQLW